MLNMACCLSSHLRFNHPGKEKNTVLNKAPVALVVPVARSQ